MKVRRRPTDSEQFAKPSPTPWCRTSREAPGLRQLEDDTTISFAFDGRNYVNLRLLINQINEWR